MDGIHGIASAEPGWRVVYVRRSPPWIGEVVPVAVWALMDDERFGGRRVEPLILEGATVLCPPSLLRQYVLVSPGESLDRVIEDAKEEARQNARWARKNAKAKRKREEERTARAAAIAADPSLAPPPRDDKRIRAWAKEAALSMRGWNLSDGERLDLLAYLLARGCVVDADAEVDSELLFRRYESWCTAWQVEPMSKAVFSTTLGRKFKGRRSGNRYVAWMGLRLKEGAEAVKVAGDIEADRDGLRKFIRGYIHFSWDGNTLKERDAVACYHAWCRWNNQRPCNRTELVAAITKTAPRGAVGGRDGNHTWERMQCRWGRRK